MHHTRRQFLLSTAAVGATAAACAPTTASGGMHIVLVGDSIFDNATYVAGKPSVIELLEAELGARGRASLLAKDGDVVAKIAAQLRRLPADATHLVVSVGGNDALQHTGLLDKAIASSRELLAELASLHAAFRSAYRDMLAAVGKLGKPTAVCTIYDSNFEPPKKVLADVALTVFNDAILRCAGEAGVPVIDLRRIFTERRDYANAIEPSEIGGAKMVRTIVAVAEGHRFAEQRTAIYA